MLSNAPCCLSLTLLSALIGSLVSSDSKNLCLDMDFHRRNILDGFKFASHLSSEMFDVSKVKCSQWCSEAATCNLILYHESERRCRLHKHVFNTKINGNEEPGWEFYGASCASYRLENAKPDVDVLATSSEDLCVDGYQAVCGSGFSCWDGGSWKTVPFRCLKFFDLPMLNLSSTGKPSIRLDFDLESGMTVLFEISGNGELNTLILKGDDQYFHYLLSIRWSYNTMVFNTMLSSGWGDAVSILEIPIDNPYRFTMEIQITQSNFLTYFDGSLMLINPVRSPMIGVKTVVLEGVLAIYRFEINKEDGC